VALRRLEGWGFVDRVSKAGERKDFFRNRPDAWTELMQRRQRTLIDFQRMAARGLELLETDDADVRRGLTEMLEFYTYFEREQPKILRGWLEWKAARARDALAQAEGGRSA
jgi:DNA-binding transcriptional regulator GbsR (MarR family)